MMTKKVGSKEALLDAATRLFTERGYKAVSTRDLAEAAGVNLATIQYHFGSKAKLFVEVVHTLMAGSGCVEARLDIVRIAETPIEASKAIARYVVGFLAYLLECDKPQACRLMLREAFTDHSEDAEMFEALLSSVVENYLRPLEDALVRVIGIVAPKLSRVERLRCARSIAGQCSFYASHKPFIERIDGKNFNSEASILELAEHIIRFSLSGLTCDDDLVAAAVSSIEESAAAIFHSSKES